VSIIQISEHGIKIVQRDLKRMHRKYERAIRRAVSTATKSGATRLDGLIRKEVKLTKAEVYSPKLKTGAISTSIIGDEGIIITKSRAMLLGHFKPKVKYGRRKRKSRFRRPIGVTVDVGKTTPRKLIRGAFIVKVAAGNREVTGVAVREEGVNYSAVGPMAPEVKRYKKTGNVKFRMLYAASPAQITETLKKKTNLLPKIADKFESELERQIKLIELGKKIRAHERGFRRT